VKSYDEFLDEALAAGTGRGAGGLRQIPAFVPSGSMQDKLFDHTAGFLVRRGFRLLDVRGPRDYAKAIDCFPSSWPVFAERPLAEDYRAPVPDAHKRLLIICGPESQPRFWKHLRNNSAFYVGMEFPPIPYVSRKCVIIPDAACVCAILMERDFESYPSDYFSPVCHYASEKSAWVG
jgi:hypothetical protein